MYRLAAIPSQHFVRYLFSTYVSATVTGAHLLLPRRNLRGGWPGFDPRAPRSTCCSPDWSPLCVRPATLYLLLVSCPQSFVAPVVPSRRHFSATLFFLRLFLSSDCLHPNLPHHHRQFSRLVSFLTTVSAPYLCCIHLRSAVLTWSLFGTGLFLAFPRMVPRTIQAQLCSHLSPIFSPALHSSFLFRALANRHPCFSCCSLRTRHGPCFQLTSPRIHVTGSLFQLPHPMFLAAPLLCFLLPLGDLAVLLLQRGPVSPLALRSPCVYPFAFSFIFFY